MLRSIVFMFFLVIVAIAEAKFQWKQNLRPRMCSPLICSTNGFQLEADKSPKIRVVLPKEKWELWLLKEDWEKLNSGENLIAERYKKPWLLLQQQYRNFPKVRVNTAFGCTQLF